MASTAQLRQWWASYRCDTSKYERVAIPGTSGDWLLWVARPTVPLFRAFAQVMKAHRYYFRELAGGTYNCRTITGSDNWSLHAYGIAIDLNPTKNPFGNPLRHDYPPGFVEAVEAITTGGRRAFTWGGRWATPDAMHFQVDVAPSQIEEENMEELVKRIQEALNEAGLTPVLTVDGVWGEKTKNRFIAGLNLGSGVKGDKGDKGDRGPKGDPGADGTLIVRGTKEI